MPAATTKRPPTPLLYRTHQARELTSAPQLPVNEVGLHRTGTDGETLRGGTPAFESSLSACGPPSLSASGREQPHNLQTFFRISS